MAMQDKLPEALEALNEVRDRVDLPAVSASTKTEFMKLLRHERMVELAFEGHRFWDLRRWGLLESTVKNATDILGDLMYERVYQPRHEIWPIPFVEMERNPNLTQNEDW